MPSENEPLISQLDSINEYFASCVRVIIHASEMLTKGSGKNDFMHSEAVHQRLSELLPEAQQFGLNEAEIFVLIASAYLHDIKHSNTESGQRHGEASAKMINDDSSLRYIFPSGDIQNQVAKICYYHDREIKELENLEETIKLDFRPCYSFKISNMVVRPRMMGALFRLADELECNSDRMLAQSANENDPRTIIAGVRIDLESRFIYLDFKYGATKEKWDRCVEHIHTKFETLNNFLNTYGLSFKIANELPESEFIDEKERVDTQKGALEYEEEGSKHYVKPQKAANFDILMKVYQQKRMNRIDSVTSIFPERGIKND